mgnify:FL=1
MIENNNMNEIDIDLKNLTSKEKKEILSNLKAGQTILLSGTVYTARDAAHKRIANMIKIGERLPITLDGAIIYYAGPTPAKNGMVIGACGPTTSARMDKFTPTLYDLGVIATIGKGERDQEISLSCKKNKSLYFCAVGGAGALAATKIKKCDVVAFDDLGCESIKKLEFDKFPLIVATDSKGNDIFKRNEETK